jgi:hypothetical protein
MLCLTIALGADRTGRAYDGPIAPDQLVAANWAGFGGIDDPVLQAAVAWLRTELRRPKKTTDDGR